MAWHIPIPRAAALALSLALLAAIAPAGAATVPELPDPIVIGTSRARTWASFSTFRGDLLVVIPQYLHG